MRPEQVPIAEWMRDVLARHGMSARKWATLAGMGHTSVSRAIKENYQFVTSTATLAKLGEVIGERPPGSPGSVPSVESLHSVMKYLMDAFISARADPDAVAALAAALRQTLLQIADEPAAVTDPSVARALARVASRPFLPPTRSH